MSKEKYLQPDDVRSHEEVQVVLPRGPVRLPNQAAVAQAPAHSNVMGMPSPDDEAQDRGLGNVFEPRDPVNLPNSTVMSLPPVDEEWLANAVEPRDPVNLPLSTFPSESFLTKVFFPGHDHNGPGNPPIA